jgi:hypothetical protein
MQANNKQIEAILKQAWGIAVQRNPMLMAKLRPDYDFTRLNEMIRDCLAKGLTLEETCEHAIKELLETARSYSQPSESCDRKPEPAHNL